MQWFSRQYGLVSSLITLHGEGVLSAELTTSASGTSGASQSNKKLLFPHVCPLTRCRFPPTTIWDVLDPPSRMGNVNMMPDRISQVNAVFMAG